jgi:hypothetical protein
MATLWGYQSDPYWSPKRRSEKAPLKLISGAF